MLSLVLLGIVPFPKKNNYTVAAMVGLVKDNLTFRGKVSLILCVQNTELRMGYFLFTGNFNMINRKL